MNAIRLAVVTGALIAAESLAVQSTQAQDRPPPGPGQGGAGGPGMRGPGVGGPGMGPGRMRMGPRPVLTATDKYVYVLRGDTLFQYSADGLKLMARAELPRPEPRDYPDGRGAPRKQ